MELASEFYERMRRAVGRAVQHIEGFGIDAEALDGVVTLVIRDGQLQSIQLPTGVVYPEAGKAPSLPEVAMDEMVEDTALGEESGVMTVEPESFLYPKQRGERIGRTKWEQSAQDEGEDSDA